MKVVCFPVLASVTSKAPGPATVGEGLDASRFVHVCRVEL